MTSTKQSKSVPPAKRLTQQTLLPFAFAQNTNVDNSTNEDATSSSKRQKKQVQIRGTSIQSLYCIPKFEISTATLEEHKKVLTLTPRDTGFGQAPASFTVYVESKESLYVPRYYGIEHYGMPDVINASDGQVMNHPFSGSLNDVQLDAVNETVQKLNENVIGGAMLVLPCGYGKTVCALNICTRMKRKTLVLVHKTFLVEQWHERAKQFIPDASLGIIRQDKFDADADIVVGMIQSISKRSYDSDMMRRFGLVIVDEAHHMSAPVFSMALREVSACKILALSATPERKDGLTSLLYWSMGSICHRIERKPEHTLVSCILYDGGARKEIKMRNGQVSLPSMLNALAKDNIRNNLIAEHMKECYNNNRHIIVLSDRICQLEELHNILVNYKHIPEEDVAYYIAKTNAKDRKLAEKKRIILSTYSMAKEGLDIPRLCTVVFATPKGDVIQASGRVQRKHPDKSVPLIIDVVDTFSIFENLRWKRFGFYKAESFQCQTLNAQDPNAQWFQ